MEGVTGGLTLPHFSAKTSLEIRLQADLPSGSFHVRSSTLVICALTAAALALSACGRAGPLEPPPGSEPYTDDPFVMDPLIAPSDNSEPTE